MPSLRSITTLNAIEAGTLSGETLTSLLSDASRASEFNVLINELPHITRISYSDIAIGALCANAKAMSMICESTSAFMILLNSQIAIKAICASATALEEVIASATALAAFMSSPTAVTALCRSSAARTVLFNSDTMMTAVANSTIAQVAIKAAPGYMINMTSNVGTTPVSTTLSGNYVMIGWSQAGTNTVTTLTGRKSGSSIGLLATTTAISPTVNASTINVLPLCSPVTLKVNTTVTTIYLGVLPI